MKNSIGLKTKWSDPQFKETQLKILRDAFSNHNGPNNCEKRVFEILLEIFKGSYNFTGTGSTSIGGRYPDFIDEANKTIIEFFGNYWHSEAHTGVPVEEHTSERIAFFTNLGYRTLIVWEDELTDVCTLKKKLMEFHNGY